MIPPLAAALAVDPAPSERLRRKATASATYPGLASPTPVAPAWTGDRVPLRLLPSRKALGSRRHGRVSVDGDCSGPRSSVARMCHGSTRRLVAA